MTVAKTYKGWEIHESYFGYYEATRPDREDVLFAKGIDALKIEIDEADC